MGPAQPPDASLHLPPGGQSGAARGALQGGGQLGVGLTVPRIAADGCGVSWLQVGDSTLSVLTAGLTPAHRLAPSSPPGPGPDPASDPDPAAGPGPASDPGPAPASALD